MVFVARTLQWYGLNAGIEKNITRKGYRITLEACCVTLGNKTGLLNMDSS